MLANFSRPFGLIYASRNKHNDAAILFQFCEVDNQRHADQRLARPRIVHQEETFGLGADQEADFLVTSKFFPDRRLDWKPIAFILYLTICQILPGSIVL